MIFATACSWKTKADAMTAAGSLGKLSFQGDDSEIGRLAALSWDQLHAQVLALSKTGPRLNTMKGATDA